MQLNGTARVVIPIAAILSLAFGLHALQQKGIANNQDDILDVRACTAENETAIARVDERTVAQFDEILRRLEAIDKKLD